MPNNLDILLEVTTLPEQTLEDVQAYAPIRGAAGADGEDGQEVTLRVLSQVLQWKYVSDPSYTNLIDFTTLTLAATQITQDTSNRFVTDTEKTTWNGKQNALTNPVTGTGNTNVIPVWNGTSITNSELAVSGGNLIWGRNNSIDNVSFHIQGTANSFYNTLVFYGNNFSGYGAQISIGTYGNIMLLGANEYRFRIAGNDKMYLNQNGRLLLNTTVDAGFLFDANGTARIVGALTLGSTIKTAQTSANGAGTWKLGKVIGADGTGAASFIEVDIDGVIYILPAKVK